MRSLRTIHRHQRRSWPIWGAVLATHAGIVAPVSAMDAPLTDAIPADAAVVYVSAHPPAADPADPTGSSLALAAMLIDRAQRVGLFAQIEESVRCWLDSAVAASLVQNYPHALALLDISSRGRADGGHELAGLHGALVVRTGDDVARVERQIQHVLNTYTNSAESTLVTDKDRTPQRFALRDRRMPAWAIIEWGRIGDLYVLTIGEGTFDRVARTIAGKEPALSDEKWFAAALAHPQLRVARTEGKDASHALLVRFDLLRGAGDAAFTQKANRVQAALGLNDVDRGLWTAQRSGRSGEVVALLRRNGKEVLTTIAGVRFLEDLQPGIIPEGATRFVVFQCEPASAIRTIAQTWLLSQSQDGRDASRAFWRSLQKDAGVSFESDIFTHLGPRIVMHDYPPHVLRLALARTFLFPITGDATVLRDRIDRLFGHLAKSEDMPPIPQLRHDPDGVWYLYVGLEGPALTVTDDWLVVSFSPRAVREIVDGLHPKTQPDAVEP